MKKLQASLTAATLAAAFAATSILPTNAAPTFVPKPVTAQSDVIQVNDGRRGWYNGYRGYPRYRYGYRYNNGFWFPAGAFVAGALIGGAIANNRYYGGYYGGYYTTTTTTTTTTITPAPTPRAIMHPATTLRSGFTIRREAQPTDKGTVTAIETVTTGPATTTISPARRDCRKRANAEPLCLNENPASAGFLFGDLGFGSKRITCCV